MNTIHLYLRRGASGALNVVRSVFTPAGGAPAMERSTVPAGEVSAWLDTQLADDAVKAVYNCSGSGITKPDPCYTPWFDLPAGHPVEKL